MGGVPHNHCSCSVFGKYTVYRIPVGGSLFTIFHVPPREYGIPIPSKALIGSSRFVRTPKRRCYNLSRVGGKCFVATTFEDPASPISPAAKLPTNVPEHLGRLNFQKDRGGDSTKQTREVKRLNNQTPTTGFNLVQSSKGSRGCKYNQRHSNC